jgi:hypothetical protein
MMNYEFDQEKNIIDVYISDVMVVGDPIRYFQAIDEDETTIIGAQERVHFTGVKSIQLSYSDLDSIKQAFLKYRHYEKVAKGVFIVDSVESHGMARMVLTTFKDIFDQFEIKKVKAKG